jgi:hypothetical protein
MNRSFTDEQGERFDHKRFAELIVRECCEVLSKEDIRHGGYGYNQHALYQQLRDHFGVGK